MEFLKKIADEQPYPLVFATISGAHLYGFPSSDSDYDLRGAHILPAEELLGLDDPSETIDLSTVNDGTELDLVTHDIKKFMKMLLKKNGYVLEQLYSPLIVKSSSAHNELKEIAKDCITKYHFHHYQGFAKTQWELFKKHDPPRVKPLLYVFRVLLTGIHLMQTGEIEANLINLNQKFNLTYIEELVTQKINGPEKAELEASSLVFYEKEFRRLLEQLEIESNKSSLVEYSSAKPALNDILVRLRQKQGLSP